ncbi:hypothetical protein J6590_003852 [Homalodisca vitripennis]|nr:hypothetical protein J6590_003852 [Homalodisca vitripennis]
MGDLWSLYFWTVTVHLFQLPLRLPLSQVEGWTKTPQLTLTFLGNRPGEGKRSIWGNCPHSTRPDLDPTCTLLVSQDLASCTFTWELTKDVPFFHQGCSPSVEPRGGDVSVSPEARTNLLGTIEY